MNKQHVVKVAIIGSPNVGKSSILNKLVDNKNSIVSPTPHTTRDMILGVCNRNNTQIIFLDTPGYIRKGSSQWSNYFITTTIKSIRDADAILVVVDGTRFERFGTKEIINKFGPLKNTLIAINKVDLKRKPQLYEMAQEITEAGYGNMIYLISAKSGEGLEDLKNGLVEFGKEEQWHFESNLETLPPKESYAAECVREKVFYCMKKEIPFSIETVPESWSFESPWMVRVNIIVSKQSHKQIIIGQGGESIKRIGTASRTELESIWGKGSLFTRVIVKENR